MNNTLTVNFTFDHAEVRTVTEGEIIWFVGKDVATILGHTNPERAIRKFVDEEDRGVTELVTPGGIQSVTVISEYGVYSLILSSHTVEARQFKHWVTHEVLPSIRKQGFYSLLTKEKLIEVLTDKQREDNTYLDCIDKQAIKRQVLQETREKRIEETRKIWVREFNGKVEPNFSPEIKRELSQIWEGDMPMFHKYLDKYHSDCYKKQKGKPILF
nr:MAG TPA: repressor domain protein [Caudoviricetes sp.]